MLTDLLIKLVVGVVAPAINDVIPSLHVGTLTTNAYGFSEEFGALVGQVGIVVTRTVLQAWMTAIFGSLVACAGYAVFQWVWSHVPSVAGFST